MLIPFDTLLPAFRLPLIKEAIERRRKRLSKLKYGEAEMSLWLMMEIEHLFKLYEFNKPLSICPCLVKIT